MSGGQAPEAAGPPGASIAAAGSAENRHPADPAARTAGSAVAGGEKPRHPEKSCENSGLAIREDWLGACSMAAEEQMHGFRRNGQGGDDGVALAGPSPGEAWRAADSKSSRFDSLLSKPDPVAPRRVEDRPRAERREVTQDRPATETRDKPKPRATTDDGPRAARDAGDTTSLRDRAQAKDDGKTSDTKAAQTPSDTEKTAAGNASQGKPRRRMAARAKRSQARPWPPPCRPPSCRSRPARFKPRRRRRTPPGPIRPSSRPRPSRAPPRRPPRSASCRTRRNGRRQGQLRGQGGR